MDPLFSQVHQSLRDAGHDVVQPLHFREVGGGCINRTGFLSTPAGEDHFFIKIHRSNRLPNFIVEAEALREFDATKTLRVPRPLAHGATTELAFLVLEALPLSNSPTSAEAEAELGRGLAAMHRCQAKRFGWTQDNVIGDTPQPNAWEDDWVTFFREHRLRFQIELAERNGLDLPLSSALLNALPEIIGQEDHHPSPSLLHGDLWRGNIAFANGTEPVIYDPALYYGDRETDIAFTEMFGGLSSTFYRAYNEVYALNKGYPKRRPLYNLYHVLNHFNLFGGHYGQQAQQTIRLLLDQ